LGGERFVVERHRAWRWPRLAAPARDSVVVVAVIAERPFAADLTAGRLVLGGV
jgi:hypothetical protein